MSKKIPSNFNLLSNPKAVSFFPTNIFILRNKDYEKDNKNLINYTKRYINDGKKSLKKSNYGGFHSSMDIGNLKEFKNIKLKLIDSYAAIVSINYGHECIKIKVDMKN